jgi:hypothetical protein
VLFIEPLAAYGSGSTVVEHSPHHAKVQGSNPAGTANIEEEIMAKM